MERPYPYRRALLALAALLLLATPATLPAQDTPPEAPGGTEITTDALTIPGLDETPEEGTTTTSGEELTLAGLLQAGGWTMYLLIGFLFLLIFLLIFNLVNLQKKNFVPIKLEAALTGDMEQANLEAAAQHCQKVPSCLASAVVAGLAQITTRGYGAIDSERFEHHVSDACARFSRARARGVNYFAILAQAAPMLGLLGTVSGMIKAFSNLGREGMGDPSKLAGNISEALVTTAAGLVIALPAVFCYFIFRENLRALVGAAEDKAFSLFEHLRHTVVSNNIPPEQAIASSSLPPSAPSAPQQLPAGKAPATSQPLVAQKKVGIRKPGIPPPPRKK